MEREDEEQEEEVSAHAPHADNEPEPEEEEEELEEEAAPAAVEPTRPPVRRPLFASVQKARVSETPARTAAANAREKQEQMLLEPVNRGRFEKSEPTIVDGQDLDIPTFLRKKLKIR